MTVWWSRTILMFAVLAFALLPAGALGTRFGLWHFGTGIQMLMASAFLAAVVFLLGLVCWFIANGRGLSGDRSALTMAIILSVVIGGIMIPPVMAAFSVPQIHNISTDVNDPPAFDQLVAARGDDSNPLPYDAATLADQQQAAYPDVQSLELSSAPAATLEQAASALAEMGLEVVNRDPAAGIVEAVATSFWFGFKDDLVVRIRPTAAGGSLVDVRSVSRVGRSDLGANAKRISTLLGKLGA